MAEARARGEPKKKNKTRRPGGSCERPSARAPPASPRSSTAGGDGPQELVERHEGPRPLFDAGRALAAAGASAISTSPTASPRTRRTSAGPAGCGWRSTSTRFRSATASHPSPVRSGSGAGPGRDRRRGLRALRLRARGSGAGRLHRRGAGHRGTARRATAERRRAARAGRLRAPHLRMVRAGVRKGPTRRRTSLRPPARDRRRSFRGRRGREGRRVGSRGDVVLGHVSGRSGTTWRRSFACAAAIPAVFRFIGRSADAAHPV